MTEPESAVSLARAILDTTFNDQARALARLVLAEEARSTQDREALEAIQAIAEAGSSESAILLGVESIARHALAAHQEDQP